MSRLAPWITPLVITYNEEANIARVLAKLGWAGQIVVIDSGSADATLDILRSTPNVRVIHRPFDSFAGQCNFGLEQIDTPWVLSLDADYELSEDCVAEILALQDDPAIDGYRAGFIYRICGHPVRGSLYPPRIVLYRVARGRYRDEGHGHRVTVSGTVAKLKAPIFHDDRKPLSRWFGSQQRYAEREADMLLGAEQADLSLADRLRKSAWLAPPLVLAYVLFAKGSILSGWPGLYYALQRGLAETMIALELIDRRLRRAVPPRAGPMSDALPGGEGRAPARGGASEIERSSSGR